jgi:hypothetical protein
MRARLDRGPAGRDGWQKFISAGVMQSPSTGDPSRRDPATLVFDAPPDTTES